MIPIRDHNPSARTPFVTWAIIALNVGLYLWDLAFWQNQNAQYALYYDYSMIPARITAGENYPSLLTSAFLHAGFFHLAGNMLFLWIFGDNLEDEMGHGPFLAFYLACAAASGLAQWATAPWSPIPMVGASGAIAGVMGGYLLLFPKAKVDILIWIIVFVRILPIPAWLMLGLWFAFQLFNGLGSNAMDAGVAYWAHAGGFVIGLVLCLPVWLRRGGRAFWDRTDGHPQYPAATDPFDPSSVPRVSRRR